MTDDTSCRNFEDLAFLFSCDNRNRGILRMNFDEAALLWKAVRASHGELLEIGRRHGGSTVLLALASGTRQVTSVDVAPAHHAKAENFFVQPEVAVRLELLVGDSRQAIPGRSFGFALVDGDHSFEGVLHDVLAHWPALRGSEPPLCAFHDAVPNPGLRTSPEGGAEVARVALRHVEDPGFTNHYVGVECVCAELLACRAARTWGEAGSMLVLEKHSELPPDFAARTDSRLQAWRLVSRG